MPRMPTPNSYRGAAAYTVYAVRWSYANHTCVFYTLEDAKKCAEEDKTLTWEHFCSDMEGVETWESSYPLYEPGEIGTVTITKYPLGLQPSFLAGF